MNVAWSVLLVASYIHSEVYWISYEGILCHHYQEGHSLHLVALCHLLLGFWMVPHDHCHEGFWMDGMGCGGLYCHSHHHLHLVPWGLGLVQLIEDTALSLGPPVSSFKRRSLGCHMGTFLMMSDLHCIVSDKLCESGDHHPLGHGNGLPPHLVGVQ